MRYISRHMQEFVIGTLLLLVTVLLVNPFGIVMLDMTAMAILTLLIVLYIAFAALIWREHAADERESLHRFAQARVAYLTGTGVLLLGIIVQSLQYTLDPWLPAALGMMVLGKIAAHVYYQWYC